MVNFQKSLDIVIAEDDEDDYLFIAEALKVESEIGLGTAVIIDLPIRE